MDFNRNNIILSKFIIQRFRVWIVSEPEKAVKKSVQKLFQNYLSKNIPKYLSKTSVKKSVQKYFKKICQNICPKNLSIICPKICQKYETPFVIVWSDIDSIWTGKIVVTETKKNHLSFSKLHPTGPVILLGKHRNVYLRITQLTKHSWKIRVTARYTVSKIHKVKEVNGPAQCKNFLKAMPLLLVYKLIRISKFEPSNEIYWNPKSHLEVWKHDF